ncbi:glycosyltransferase [uncultured Mitsuokella sp.]|uniref:glycosyltransferase family 2 protein n=1 Tax=uncultured Mitsuokella sp. TaxID=453120 RepID=UPI002628698D|nr:glycosyltransferase [uncultured Mitsuokella sp.]
MPEISVIVPVYNVEPYLKQCIESVQNQTFQDLEIILVDDGSTDGSGKICKEYEKNDQRIQVIHKANGGLGDARNVGLDAARGEYIGFVDSDDFIDVDMYELLYKNAISHKADISMCRDRGVPVASTTNDCCDANVVVLDGAERIIQEIFLSRKTAVAVCLKLYHRSIFSTLRFPVDMTTEDGYIFLDIVHHCHRMVLQNISKYNYRIRSGSITKQRRYTSSILDLANVYKRNYDRVIAMFPQLKEVAAYRLWWAYRETLARIGATSDYAAQEDVIVMLQTFLRKNAWHVFWNSHMSYAQKFATLVAMCSCRTYAKLKRYV